MCNRRQYKHQCVNSCGDVEKLRKSLQSSSCVSFCQPGEVTQMDGDEMVCVKGQNQKIQDNTNIMAATFGSLIGVLIIVVIVILIMIMKMNRRLEKRGYGSENLVKDIDISIARDAQF